MGENGENHKNLRLAGKLGEKGLRLTSHRALVYEVVSSGCDHPSAEEVFARARKKIDSISLATVYNCLETLVECGMVRSVCKGRMGARYCANDSPHAHLHLSEGSVVDVPLSEADVNYLRGLVSREYRVDSFDLDFSGGRIDPQKLTETNFL